MQVTKQLAERVLHARWSDVPAVVRHEGKRAFLNWVGCALGGCHHPATESALRTLAEFSGPKQATVLGRGVRMDALSAALLNGLSASAHAYDDTHLETIAHPSAPTGAALLAVAERFPVQGTDFLHGFILSNEVQCRLSCALARPPASTHVGYYMTGLTGAVGVAAAAGRLLGLDQEQLVWAVGLGAAQGSGFRATHASMASGYVPAHAGRSGLLAALLARNGFTCSENALEGRNGFGDVFSERATWDALFDGFGERYEAMSVAAKPYPTGCFVHPAIDVCLELTRAQRRAPEEIERIELSVHPLALGLTGRTQPKTGYDTQVSVHHWAAAVLTRGGASLAEAGDEAVVDPAIVALRSRVEAAVDPALAPDEAKGRLLLRDGSEMTAHVSHCLGSAARPMSDAELETKFLDQAEAVMPAANARRLLEACWSIEGAEDVGRIAPGVWGPSQSAGSRASE